MKLVFYACVLSAFVATFNAEIFSETRDGHDSSEFQKNHRVVIQDVDHDGQLFLLRYGYLKGCVPGNIQRKRRSLNPLIQLKELVHSLDSGASLQSPVCSKQMITDAVKALQRHFKLPETGGLDDRTIGLMNQGRCGVGDASDALKEEAAKVKSSSKSSSTSSRRRRSVSTISLVDTARLFTSALGTHRRRRREILAAMLRNPKPRVRIAMKHRRSKRRVNSNVSDGSGRFPRRQLTWRLLPHAESRRIPDYLQRYFLQLAFRMWSEVSPLLFVEDTNSAEHDVNILISFGTKSHENCAHDFDGAGGEIAHSRITGPVHVDDDEDFQLSGTSGVDILRVFVHEIGHSLGLKHIFSPSSIMYPVNVNRRLGTFELADPERRAVQDLYGKCNICIDLVFDWLRNGPTGTPIYNTYIFALGVYWMYENREARPRYGDPKQVGIEWRGLPTRLNGVIQLMEWTGSQYSYLTLFFSGCSYYRYDDRRSEVMPGYPRNITADFGPRQGSQLGIPCNIDSAFYDYRLRMLLFFKGDKIYFYTPGSVTAFRQNNCCERVQPFSEVFPIAPGNKTMTRPIDTVYLHLGTWSLYFFSGSDYWQDMCYNPRGTFTKGCLVYQGQVSGKWNDLCFVNNESCSNSGF